MLPGRSGLHSRLTRRVRPRLEGKKRTPLSCRVATGISWSPLRGVKGVKLPMVSLEGLQLPSCRLGVGTVILRTRTVQLSQRFTYTLIRSFQQYCPSDLIFTDILGESVNSEAHFYPSGHGNPSGDHVFLHPQPRSSRWVRIAWTARRSNQSILKDKGNLAFLG